MERPARRRRPPSAGPAGEVRSRGRKSQGRLAVFLLALLMVLPAGAWVSRSLSPSPGSAEPHLIAGAPAGAPGPQSNGISSAVAVSSGSPLDCAALSASWAALYGSGPAPPAVAGSSEPGCIPGPDEEGVSLQSNATDSGSAFEITVAFPSNASSAPISLSEFWISLAVRGVPCSLDGQSILRIDFAPPDSPLGGPGVWAVETPVWSLVPAGSCDPRCENASALYDLGGTSFCLDDTLERVADSSGGSLPRFATGDTVRITVLNSSGGLRIYANDTTRPVLSTTWSYPVGSLDSGDPVRAFGGIAAPGTGWTYGGAVGFGWTNCPWIRVTGPPSCNSYDGVVGRALSDPSVTNATSWNVSTVSYSTPFEGYDPWSSSGACQGDVNVTSCLDFASYGGTAEYPVISISAGGGAAQLEYGGNGSGEAGPLSGTYSQFAADGSTRPTDPAIVRDLSASVNATAIVVQARATDPRGIHSVSFSAVWCFSGGTGTTPTPLTTQGAKAAGPGNGSEDAYWNATFPRGNNATGGTLYYSAVEFTSAGDPGSAPARARASVPSSGIVCGPITSPIPIPIRSTAIAEGYHVQWSYPTPSLGYIENFSIVATPPVGPPVVAPEPPVPGLGGLFNGTIGGLTAGVAYGLQIHSTLIDGSAGPVAPTSLTGAATYDALRVDASALDLSLVQPASISDTFNASAQGGVGPYSYAFSLGNGSTQWQYRQSTSTLLSVSYVGYWGVARVEVTVNDSVGDVASATALYVEVRATPGGVPLVLSTGDGIVGLHWSAPASPSGAVIRYVLFYSQSALALPQFTSSWPDNRSQSPAILIWNTTQTSFNFSATDGQSVYAEVIAWNPWGAGLAPATGAAEGVPTPFVLTGLGPAPGSAYGGAAPFTASFTASTTGGNANNLTSAIVTASEIAPVSRPLLLVFPASLASLFAMGATFGWANGSLTFNASGTYLIEIHLEDALGDPALIGSFDLYVGTGIPPTVTVAISTLTAIPFAGSPVDFQATASGTPGPYNYSWQFGDGSTAFDAGPTPSHRYASAGLYTAILTVVDEQAGGVASVAQTVDVNAYPVVRISASEGTAGDLSWSFEAIEIGGSGPPQLAWSFGDGATANGPDVSHVYASPGTYTVHVTLADPAGIPTVSSNLTIYAGVPAATQSFAQSAAAIGLILVLSVAVLALAVLTVIFYRRSRIPPPTSLGVAYPTGRAPPPRDRVD